MLIARWEPNRTMDKIWVDRAINKRHDVGLYLYDEKNTYLRRLTELSNVVIVEPNKGHKNYLMKVSSDLNTSYPTEKSYERYYYMIKEADSLYLVAHFTDSGRLHIKGLQEAWIVEMFVRKLQGLDSGVCLKGSYPVYLYSEDMHVWCQLSSRLKWGKIARPPSPVGKYIALVACDTDISPEATVEINIL